MQKRDSWWIRGGKERLSIDLNVHVDIRKYYLKMCTGSDNNTRDRNGNCRDWKKYNGDEFYNVFESLNV